MSEIISFESRKKSVRYVVEIEHKWNGQVDAFVVGVEDNEHNRKEVAKVLRQAADAIENNPPEGSH